MAHVTNTLPTRPCPDILPPSCCPLRETTPAPTSHVLLTEPTLPRLLEGDLPPTHHEPLGNQSPTPWPSFHPLSPPHSPTHQPACFTHPHATSKWHSSGTHQFLTTSWAYCCCLGSQWDTTPVLLPGKSHGRRSLVGCSSGGCKELDTTEQLHFHFSVSYIGEGNGNPLQCSCLENPRDGGAWWAAVSGVAQSGTRLKRLSSSSSSRVTPTWLLVFIHAAPSAGTAAASNLVKSYSPCKAKVWHHLL